MPRRRGVTWLPRRPLTRSARLPILARGRSRWPHTRSAWLPFLPGRHRCRVRARMRSAWLTTLPRIGCHSCPRTRSAWVASRTRARSARLYHGRLSRCAVINFQIQRCTAREPHGLDQVGLSGSTPVQQGRWISLRRPECLGAAAVLIEDLQAWQLCLGLLTLQRRTDAPSVM